MLKNVSIFYQNNNAVMTAFQSLVDRLVQSYASVMADRDLELVMQVIFNCRGGAKRKLGKTLEDELLVKKACHLYVTLTGTINFVLPSPSFNQLILISLIARL